jgi:SAM-dependent methyltransferase
VKRVSLNDLVCPAVREGKRCYGQLEISESVIPLVHSDKSPSEILEGIVRCLSCGEEYPIICGVLILVNDVKTYLARYYSEIMSAAALCDISKDMVAYLQKGGYDLHDMGFQNTFWTNTWGMSIYICAHYDDLANMVEHSHPLKALLQQDFYVKILDMIDRAPVGILKGDGRAIDIGCNVGGMSWRLAERCKFVYGIDVSFRALLIARQIILGQPKPLKNYRFYREGLLYEERSLSVPQRQNCELFVASGLDLPFKKQSFEFISCENVVDEISHPDSLLQESLRVLKDGGGFLLTDPYFWSLQRTPIESWFGTNTGKPTAAALREQLTQMCNIVGEEEKLPWILRVYDRYFTVYLNHCILVQKKQ